MRIAMISVILFSTLSSVGCGNKQEDATPTNITESDIQRIKDDQKIADDQERARKKNDLQK